MDTPISQVYVLLYYNLLAGPPEPLVFDALPKLQQHVVDLVVKKLDKFEEMHRVPLQQYANNKMYDNFFKFWRYLQKEKLCRAGFDAHWEDEPQVVL